MMELGARAPRIWLLPFAVALVGWLGVVATFITIDGRFDLFQLGVLAFWLGATGLLLLPGALGGRRWALLIGGVVLLSMSLTLVWEAGLFFLPAAVSALLVAALTRNPSEVRRSRTPTLPPPLRESSR